MRPLFNCVVLRRGAWLPLLLALSSVVGCGGNGSSSTETTVAPASTTLPEELPESPRITAQIPIEAEASEPGPVVVETGKVFVVAGDGAAVVSESKAPAEVDEVPLASGASELAAGGGSIWTATVDGLEEIDPDSLLSRSVVLNTDFVGRQGLAVGEGFVYANGEAGALRYSPKSEAGKKFKGVDVAAVGEGAAWGFGDGNFVERRDPKTLKLEAKIRIPDYGFDIAVGEGLVWVVTADASLVGIDPATNSVSVGPVEVPTTEAEAGTSVLDVAIGLGGVWVGEGKTLSVLRFDPTSGGLTDTIPLEGGETQFGGRVYVTVGKDAVWASNADVSGAITLTRIDPGSAMPAESPPPQPAARPLTAQDEEEMGSAARDFILEISGEGLGTPPPPSDEDCRVDELPITTSADRNQASGIAGKGQEACVEDLQTASESTCVPEYSRGNAEGDSTAAEFTALISVQIFARDYSVRARGSARMNFDFVRPLNDWLIDGASPSLASICQQIGGGEK